MRGAKVQTYREPLTFYWEITPSVKRRLDPIVERLNQISDPDDMEVATLRDEIRRMPGFPLEARSWDNIIYSFAAENRLISIPRSN